MFASMPMYDRPELRAVHAAYWACIHDALSQRDIKSPKTLDEEGIGLAYWKQPELVLSQTCGLPYRKYLHQMVGLVATPDFAIRRCPAGYYCSYFIVRKNEKRKTLTDFVNSAFAFNDPDSQSGYAAAWNHIVPAGNWFEHVIEAGSHVRAAQCVASGAADIAAIDAISWRLIAVYEDFAADLQILEATAPTPGLPYITGLVEDSDTIYEAILDAQRNVEPEVLNVLGIRGLIKIPKANYLAIPTMP